MYALLCKSMVGKQISSLRNALDSSVIHILNAPAWTAHVIISGTTIAFTGNDFSLKHKMRSLQPL